MIELIAHNLAPIMFASLVVFLLLGYPVAFSLAANGLIFFVVGVELAPYSQSITLDWPLLGLTIGRILDVMRNDTLLAIPFFTLMGIVLEKSGMAEDLLDTAGQLFGPVRGGLAYAVILVGALLAATTGVVAASVIAMGLISMPIMLRYGYDRSLAAGVITASGTLAQIIPPSLVLIVLADQLGVSVGPMYAGAMLPGLMLVGLFCLYVLGISILRPAMAPALPIEARTLGSGFSSLLAVLIICTVIGYLSFWFLQGHVARGAGIWGAAIAATLAYIAALADKGLKLGRLSHLAQQVIIVLVPPLALIFLVLGTIFLGIATATEGGAMGATGALLMAWFKGRLPYRILSEALDGTTRLPVLSCSSLSAHGCSRSLFTA
jgi:tripartite ATP-independent transporter DctM subunit